MNTADMKRLQSDCGFRNWNNHSDKATACCQFDCMKLIHTSANQEFLNHPAEELWQKFLGSQPPTLVVPFVKYYFITFPFHPTTVKEN